MSIKTWTPFQLKSLETIFTYCSVYLKDSIIILNNLHHKPIAEKNKLLMLLKYQSGKICQKENY